MARRAVDDSDWDSDDEEYDSSEQEDDDTIPCPYCRRPIHEESERCPYCENYISEEDTPAQPRPWWLIVGFLLCAIVVYFWIMGR